MSLGLNKILVSNVATGQPASYLQPTTVSNVGAGNATAMISSQYIPAGTYIVPAIANVVIEVNTYTSNTNSWTTLVPNATPSAVLISDGFNIRANAVTGTQTVTLYTVNGGQAATQSTYATS
jgi:hypothetical protein